MARMREKIADNPVLALLDSFLKQRVMDTAKAGFAGDGDAARSRHESAAVQHLP